MSETLSTTFKNAGSNGRITLYANPFDNGSQYYGRFERNVVDTKVLIARIQNRKAGTNELAVQEIAGFLKEEILQAVRNGEAVNVMDLGILYIVPNRKFDGMSMEQSSAPALAVRFLPGSTLRNAVSGIQIKEIKLAETPRLIREVIDKYTGRTDGVISAGKFAVIKGMKLKVEGENSGLYLCPLDAQENPADEESWIKCDELGANTSGTLEFFVPSGLEKGKKLKALIRTHYCSNNYSSKEMKDIWSDVITVI
ncbi:MAG: DUF4469 domain-containing protein [Treponema sp.]|nr:DUF4469 domain-containing protein [Treponema sp.]